MHLVIKSLKTKQFNKLRLNAQIHSHKTLHATHLTYFVPRKRTELGKKSFRYYGPKMWQDVPYEIKALSVLN